MADTTRHTDYLPLHTLRGDPANPKRHDLGLLGDSVDRFGFIEPIVIDERTGYLISGHGRTETLTTMRDQGQPAPDGVHLADDGTWLVPVMRGWASRDDKEAKAALAALNRVGEKGGWVDSALHDLLADINDTPDGLTGVGFTDSDLATLQRLAEAESVYSVGVDSLLDEFRDISGREPNEYEAEYAAKVTVYLRDPEAINDFIRRLGLDSLDKAINYPPDWTPHDRRRYRDDQSEPFDEPA